MIGMEEIYGIEEFKTNFKNVIEEIDLILKGTYQEKEGLEKLKKLFSENQVKRLEELIEMMRKRTNEAEERTLVALQEAERYKNEVEKEKTRLEKLWDAYKKQEDDYIDNGEQNEEMRTKLLEKEKQIDELNSQIEDMKDLKKSYEMLERIKKELGDKNTSLEDLKKDYVKERERNKILEKELEDTKSYIPYKKQAEELTKKVQELEPLKDLVKIKEKYKEIQEQYRKEQERLAKLFKRYEEISKEYEEAKNKLDRWELWYSENKEFIESAATAFSKFKMPE